MKIREWTSKEYHNFWSEKSKKYLDQMEKKILKPLIISGNWIIDIGGGYGRLMNLYRNSFTNVIILDHSLSMLQDANEYMTKNKIKNVYLIAANVYSLPFVDNIFDEAIMIRITHHLQYPAKVFSEIHRILKKEAFFILEYQNLLNINFRIKKLFGFSKIDFDTQKPFEIGDMYYNFHPDYIHNIIKPFFTVVDKFGGGIFWNRKLLVSLFYHPEWIDYVLKRFFARFHFTHQIFLKLQAKKDSKIMKIPQNNNILDIIKCIKCNSNELNLLNDKILCSNCSFEYTISNNIYDFRI